VLTTGQRARARPGGPVDTTVAIIPKTEVGQPSAASGRGHDQLHFTARTYATVAWRRGNFIWDASGYDGILIQSFYPPEANATGRAHRVRPHSSSILRKMLPYPYPTAINVAVPVGGGVPMIVFAGTVPGAALCSA